MSTIDLPIPEALTRTLLVLALDTSRSMNENRRIHELNQGIPGFVAEMKKIAELRSGGELLVLEFGTGGVAPVMLAPRVPGSTTSFMTVASMPESLTPLVADGVSTPLGGALTEAMRQIGVRRGELTQANIGERGQTLVFIITDGDPNDAWQAPAANLRKMKNVLVFALGVGGAREATMREISPSGAYSFANLPIEEVLKIVSISARRAAEGGSYEHVREVVQRRVELAEKIATMSRQT